MYEKKLVAANYAGKLVKTVIRRNQKLIIGRGSFREKEKKIWFKNSPTLKTEGHK